MLKQNGTILAQYPFRLLGGGIAAGSRAVWGRADRINTYASEGIESNIAAVPNGHLAPSAWLLPQSPGGLSSYSEVTGSGVATSSILAVKLAEAGLTGSGDLTAVGELIVSLLADMVGSGDITDADIKAFLQLAALLSGSGEVSDPTLTGLGALVAALLGDGTAADSILTGRGAMAADIVVTGTGLTTANVGQAVWSALAAANNDAGTMGNKLNSAASGGVDYGALATAVWEHVTRTLTSGAAPSVEAIAAEVLSEMNATPPAVNIKKVNDITVSGDGSDNNPWNPV